MTGAEYAFFRIMQDQGHQLIFVGVNGTRFKVGATYRPDFMSSDRKLYYEVCGTRQAYHANKEKYALFRQTYPDLSLKIVKPDGQEIQAP